MKLEALQAIHLHLAHAAQQAKADVMREYQVLICVCMCLCVYVYACVCMLYVFVHVFVYVL
jgi:hypothetical protein